MRILISGICGFVGSRIAFALHEQAARELAADGTHEIELCGIDNFSREGSWRNLAPLRSAGILVSHGDVRSADDLRRFGRCDWLIDAAANPSVLAGLSDEFPSRPLLEVNLLGTLNQLEYCKQQQSGLILLSSSRVYSIQELSTLPISVEDHAFRFKISPLSSAISNCPTGVSAEGIDETFSTQPPLSLYGVSKLASEWLALEYHHAFDIPVWINRCGVLAGASQFGKADQGIFTYWLQNWFHRQPLRYIGFDGSGHQVRDVLHPRDLTSLIWKQLNAQPRATTQPRTINVSGGIGSAISLRQLSHWCAERWGEHPVQSDSQPRPYDLPWIVLDSRKAQREWDWTPQLSTAQILAEIAEHIEQQV